MIGRNHKSKLAFVLILAGLALLVACTSQEPIIVRITPTPNPDNATQTPLPSLTPEPSATPTLPLEVSQSASEEVQGTAVANQAGSYIGPIIGTDYVTPTDVPPPLVNIPTVTNTPEGPTPIAVPTSTGGPSPSPVPRLDASRMGVQMYSNVDYDTWMRAIGLAETTGVGWVKIQVNWDFLQPTGPNDFNEQMQLFERQIEAIARPGFNVLLSIAKAPNWTRNTDVSEAGPPDDPQALADFLSFMFTTKIGPIVDAIEIWNEPNLIREWHGALPFTGAGYMQLFRPAYDAIRAYSPSITIITAGLAPTGNLDGAVDDREFLQQMYDSGLGEYQDIVIGAHPYGWGNPPDSRCCGAPNQEPGWDEDPHFYFLNNLEDTYAIMTANGQGNNPIWITEFGWATWEGIPSDPPEAWMSYNSAAEQANYAIRAFEIGQGLPYLGPMVLWNLNFANQVVVDRRDQIAAYSVINPVLFPSERPLFWALARATGRLQDEGGS